MSLVLDVRAISRSSPSMCWKIRYKSRNDTAKIMPGRRGSSITAGQRHVHHSGGLFISREEEQSRHCLE
jgi:hypothetical protein